MNALFLSIIGSCIALDKYAFGEFGISQPLISGTIIGALYGDVHTGIFLGAIIQLICLGGLPIGTEIPPDTQTAGIIGCGSYFILRIANAPEHALFIATLFAFLTSILGGATDIVLRHFHDRLFRRFQRDEERLYTYHFIGLLTSLMRTFVIFFIVFVTASLIRVPHHFPHLSRELFLIIGISMGLANASHLFIKKSTVVYAIVGGLCGLALLVF
jgi:mannose/fructose/N-acetylgalactosamine-specific phosphotransferase system component IIC